jgi:tetratricopeptide (TPR) repeat protein
MRKILFACLLVSTALFSPLCAYAQPITPQETLKQYISELQKNQNDYTLRETIIKHVQAMKRAPAIPEEAERFMARGTAAVRAAKDAYDFKDAVAEFEKATLTAPWLASAYYNLGISQDKAGMYADAIKSLRLYLLASPGAPDATAVRNLIYEIEYRQEKAAREASPEAVAAKQQNTYEAWLLGLDGARFISAPIADGAIGHEGELMFSTYFINGREVGVGWIEGVRDTRYFDFGSAPIRQMSFNDGSRSKTMQGKTFIVPVPDFVTDQRPCTATISDDGQFITVLCPASPLPQAFTRVK